HLARPQGFLALGGCKRPSRTGGATGCMLDPPDCRGIAGGSDAGGGRDIPGRSVDGGADAGGAELLSRYEGGGGAAVGVDGPAVGIGGGGIAASPAPWPAGGDTVALSDLRAGGAAANPPGSLDRRGATIRAAIAATA